MKKETLFDNGKWLIGNCLDLMKEIPDNSIDVILCDLPFGTTGLKWDNIIPFETMWEQYNRITKLNSPIVLFAQCPFDKALGYSNIKNLKYEWIWEKEAGTGFLNSKKQPLKNHENILVFYKKQPIYNPQMRPGTPYNKNARCKITNTVYDSLTTISKANVTGERYPLSILKFNRERGFHPTQKPVPLFEYLIKTYSDEGMTILDNCAGSGTTAIASENTNRKWICMEQSEEYSEKAIERINIECYGHNPNLKDIENKFNKEKD